MTTILPPKALTRNRVVALVGNPNTGKTTLFNALAGMRQRVGNYAGVTVETKKGTLRYGGQTFDLIDLPGTYSLAPRSPDEMLAVDLILGQQTGEARPDVILSIVDASNLERNLYLTTQALEVGAPVVVALNMIDVAQAQGLRIDAERLSRQLGVRVVPIQANKGRGLEDLKRAIAAAAHDGAPGQTPLFPDAFEREVAGLRDSLGGDLSPFLLRRLILDVGGYTEQRLAERYGETVRYQVQAVRQSLATAGCSVPAVEARTRYSWIRQATAGCIERPAQRRVTWTDRLDRILTHKVWGTLVFLAVMFLVFEAIFEGARPAMDGIGVAKDWLADGVRNALAPGPLTSLLANGVIGGVGSVIVFLPQILLLFAFIAVLEDCGYMARAAFLMDRLMARCGLSGKSFIPMLSSVACAVPGIMATRVIENRRDRLATILVAPLMSCSARLPVYTLLTAAFLPVRDANHPDGFPWWTPGLVLFGLYAIGLVVAPLMALLLKRTLLRGETPVFVMEMPMYKWPSARTVLRRMLDSGWAFLRRAGTLILASMIVVWALLYFTPDLREGIDYDQRIAAAQKSLDEETDPSARAETQDQINAWQEEWTQRSILGRFGRAIEPAVAPLGWDWRIGTAALASFPAREVVVGTLGIIYKVGKVDTDDLRAAKDPGETDLGKALRATDWGQDAHRRIPVALSVMVFFALCCQCASTLAVIRRETRSWRWPAFTFAYMTVLAYLGALLVYQVGTRVAVWLA
jgi:ferrous iron transport protein B